MKIVSCTATKCKEFSPPSGAKVDSCKKCKTLVWLTREAEAAKGTGREVWCKECVETKATPEDDILGKSIHNENKNKDENQKFSTLDERIISHQKEIHETFFKNIDDKLGLLSAIAINNLAPNKDSEHLLLCCVIRTYIEQRLFAMKDEMGPSATLTDVFNRFDGPEKISILTFIIGTYHAARKSNTKDIYPSWNKRDNGQDNEFEAERDKNWNWK